MRQTVEVGEEYIAEALTLLGVNLKRRLAEKGRGSFISPHEILGAVQVELRQVEEAIYVKEPRRISEELLDVAVGCVFGVASMKAQAKQHEAKDIKPDVNNRTS